MANLKNKTNGYQWALGLSLFDEIPKSVLAAIAVSAVTNGGIDIEAAAFRVAKEWDVLHANGIVPQKPGKAARLAISEFPELDASL